MRSYSVNVIGWDNNAGISREIALLREVLAGDEFTFHFTPASGRPPQKLARIRHGLREYGLAAWHRVRRSWRVRSAGTRFDFNIFLDRPEPVHFAAARINCLIPHQEWFQPAWRPFLKSLDSVMCLTREAERIFKPISPRADYLSFTCLDRCDANVPHDYRRFVHVGGKSPQKGTPLVVETWQRHPEWPPLTVIQSLGQAPTVQAPNLRMVTHHVSDEELRRLQNEAGIHLCPSQAEAFGQTLAEAMSCRAVVVTTDASPMNELVTTERGLLAETSGSWPFGLGMRYSVSVEALEKKVNELLAMPLEQRRAIGERGRAWFEANDRFFRSRLPDLLRELARTHLPK